MRINNFQNQLSFKSAPTDKVALQVAEYISKYRRPFKNEHLSQVDREYLLAQIQQSILPFIQRNEPIDMTIVGFSMKCPSPLKVISPNADRAEFEALKHLENIANGLSDMYNPGGILNIYTDGRMFVNSIVGFSDKKVSSYVAQLKILLSKLKTKKLKIHSLEDYFSGDFETMRESLRKSFPPNIQVINQDESTKTYRRFMRDFYAKDIRAQDSSISIKRSRQLGEKVAEKVINAANSMSQFVASLHPKGMLRLSVHGKPANNPEHKIGIFLNSLNDNCPMPWHGAAIKIPSLNGDEKFLYEKKSVLDSVAEIVPDIDCNGQFYKFSDQVEYDFSKSLKDNLSEIKKCK